MQNSLQHSWYKLLKDEFEKPYFKALQVKLEQERSNFPNQIFPTEEFVFTALNACDFESVRVVILGQDPYPTPGFAHGLSFSVQPHITKIPKSLVNIYNELRDDIGIEPAETGNLMNWASQGVLLLNTILTVRSGEPLSHVKWGWEQFTDQILQQLTIHRTGIVYLLWGKNAHKKAELLDDKKNLILKTSHPSPLGFTKNGFDFEAFKGSKPFSKTNNYLIQNGLSPIDWKVSDNLQLGFDF
jgi:uracil-DNA glycosylase